MLIETKTCQRSTWEAPRVNTPVGGHPARAKALQAVEVDEAVLTHSLGSLGHCCRTLHTAGCLWLPGFGLSSSGIGA